MRAARRAHSRVPSTTKGRPRVPQVPGLPPQLSRLQQQLDADLRREGRDPRRRLAAAQRHATRWPPRSSCMREEPHAHLRLPLPPRSPLRVGGAAPRLPGAQGSSRLPRRSQTSCSRLTTRSTCGPSTASARRHPQQARRSPMPLAEPRLELEGEEILFSDGWEGDSIDNSVVWIPSLRGALRDRRRLPRLPPVAHREQRRAARPVAQGHRPAHGLRPAHRRSPATATRPSSRSLRKCWRTSRARYTDCVGWSIKYLDVYDEVYDSGQDRRRAGRGDVQAVPAREGRGLRHPLAGAPAVPREHARTG